MKLINRLTYLERLISLRFTPDIKILTGIRRSGKSKLLDAFAEWLVCNDSDANIIKIDFNDPEWDALRSYHSLYRYVEIKWREGCNNYLMIDEVQECKGFERALNGLHNTEKYDIYVTGSNAFLMSSDLATLFTGRTFEIMIFPFSFNEFREYFDITDLQEALDRYVREGGMSGSYVYANQKDRYSYVSSVFSVLIARDIQQKFKIKNKSLLVKLSEFLMDNISNLTSTTGISGELTRRNEKTNSNIIGRYIDCLCSAYLFYPVRRFDIRGKMYLETQNKCYVADHSFRYAMLGTRNMDFGRVYENIVAIELQRRGYEIYVGKLYQKEVDFVAMRRNEKTYIQVSDNISEEKTFLREIEPLMKIRDAYPKFLIARTRHEEYDREGIRIIDLADWLSRE